MTHQKLQGLVTGKLVDQDGAPITGMRIALFAKNVRSETSLGAVVSDNEGRYSIGYHGPSALNLVVHAIDTAGETIAQSATVFSAPAEIEINFTTAVDGVVRTPSTLINVNAALAAHLSGTPLSDLKENKDAHELHFLASATGVDFKHVAYRFIAHALGAKHKINEATLFGIFHQGIPPSLGAALASLPDGGIDEAFTGQVLSAVLAHSRAMLEQALTGAVKANILPASYSAMQESELSAIDALRATKVRNAPYVRGKTPLNDLLDAGGVPEPMKTAFIQAYADRNGHAESAWEALRARTDLQAEHRAMLEVTLSAGELLAGNVPLVKDTLARLSQKTLASVQHLALLDESDWVARITSVDPEATSVPRVLPTDTPQQRAAQFAKSLTAILAGRYPTFAIAGRLAKTPTASFAQTKDELFSFITTNPAFEFGQTHIDHFLATNRLTVSPPALADLKRIQRLSRVSPDYDSIEALHRLGHDSAQSVYCAGREPFLAQAAAALGGTSAAKEAYARAQMTYATALAAYGQYNLALNGINVAALASPVPSAALLTHLPDLQALFGSLDYFECGDCQSVLSPAAYLVDLLQYLAGFTATGGTVANARDALFARRPDIQYTALSCNNTNITLPYIDVVNEILESAIAPPANPAAAIETTGTAEERRAIPQNISQTAYTDTGSTLFPLSLPFDLAFARTTAYIDALGTTRAAILALFSSNSAISYADAIAGATLGMNPDMQAAIDGFTSPSDINPESAWYRWGLDEHPNQVIDPKTRVPYVPNPMDWVAALSKVPVLLNRAGITLRELYQLLEVVFVTQSGVTLQAGVTTVPPSTQQILSADTDSMVFTGLTADVLDRANRFLRLWTATGLQMWELDWAIAGHVPPDMTSLFLPFLSGAIEARDRLKLPFQTVLGFWMPLETRDVTNHLGDGDAVALSTYSEVFRNPAVLSNWGSIFVPLNNKNTIAAASNGANITTGRPHGFQSGMWVFIVGSQPLFGPVDNAYTITVTGLSSFTINGFKGPGPWASGGTVTGTLSGRQIFPLVAGPPNPEQLAISAALGVSAGDISAILAASGAASTLSLATLGQLVNYQRLASSLSLDIPHLIAWIALTGGKPFNGAPGDTLQFLRRLDVLQGTGLAAEDLNYLLRNTAPDQSSVALTADKVTGALQAIRDAVAKLPGATAIPIIGASNTSPVTVTTALPNSLQTGAQIGISGVRGNSTANGTFVVTVVNATSFTLNGSAGNGSWTGGGTVGFLPSAADDLIQTIVINALAAAIETTANVATPVILQTGVLPLAPAMIGLLIAQGSAVDVTQFPTLANLCAAVAKAAALFNALEPTEAEFAFAIQHAGSFNWFDPGTLSPPPATGNYAPFEALLQALALNGRQPANGPRLFDVLSQWLSTLPASPAAAISGGLAVALNASVDDVTAIATALGATAPSFGRSAQAGSLADMAMLTAIANALDVAARYRIDGATVVRLAAIPATADTASAAMAALQRQYSQNSWLAAIQPVEDALRRRRRDALVAYLLGRGPALTADDIFDYYLIDPEMGPEALTTRLLQPSLAIQQFVQQCFLNLTFAGVGVSMASSRWREWSWRQQFRLWQANRQVFLYPENYVLPETRQDASPFFQDLENDLHENSADADGAETAIENYLRSLVGVARLIVAASYNETKLDGTIVLHVFARTSHMPPDWFWRRRTTTAVGTKSWSAWQPLKLDITSQHLIPVVWDQQLLLVWPIFQQISQKPQPNALTTPAIATKIWTIQFAVSEFSAGQWQAKRTIDQKLFLLPQSATQYDPLWFTFQAYQDPSFNLQIEVYFALDSGSTLIAVATLPMRESPLSVMESTALVPAANLVDLTLEPTLTSVTRGSPSGTLISPASFDFAGQDWVRTVPGTGPLNVVGGIVGSGQPVSLAGLLGTIANPRIVTPHQEPDLNFAQPLFVDDASRTYLVEQLEFSVSTYSTGNAYLRTKVTAASYIFETFYHPYARTFLRQLEIGGIPQLMARNLQLHPQVVAGRTPPFDFNTFYSPSAQYVGQLYPGGANALDPGENSLDFTVGSFGAYSLYNWEVFYHIPMFVASLLMQNQQFQEAMTWLNYIFNPSDTTSNPTDANGNPTGGPVQHFWQTAPFYAQQGGFSEQDILHLLAPVTADTATALDAWLADPFDPHAVASLRISAYAKATVMKLLDLLIAWGDSYYSQYTAEMVNQAQQLYILADLILGPRPQMLRPPESNTNAAGGVTYASLQNLDPFANVLVNIENVIVAPEPPQSIVNGTATTPLLPLLSGTAATLLFCIPPNGQLLAYWDTVSQRLDNIRSGRNIHGVAQPLPLYAPPINPLSLGEARGSGNAISSTTPSAPIYRFAIYLQKAVELTSDVRTYGSLILSALEKKDAETLSVLRANQEVDIQTRILDVKAAQMTEARDQIAALNSQLAVVQRRYEFYSDVAFMNDWENTAAQHQSNAVVASKAALVLDMYAGMIHLLPKILVGAAGIASPLEAIGVGSDLIGNSNTSWAEVSRGWAGILGGKGGRAATMGAYYRRSDDWTLQADLARLEVAQLNDQITGATDRLTTATAEYSVQSRQIFNAQTVSNFITQKYANEQLYNWMVGQLTIVHTQAYQLAYSLALQAQNAYQYELGSSDTLIQSGYWDSQHKGLTAGESLIFDLRRMEAQYLAANSRELELTKHISLVLAAPMALVLLRKTGTCQIALDEVLFENDHPGQYFRRLRSVALTIPCVTGPYTGVNATLSLTNAMVRTRPPGAGYAPQSATAPANDPSVIASSLAAAGTQTIATSSGQNDAGMFDVNLRDERWLPFEGQGAISTWNLVLDPRDNNFDFSTIADVVVHLRYTARGGGDQAAANMVRTAIKSQIETSRSILVSVRSTFGNAWYSFFHPVGPAETPQTLTLPLTNVMFPYSNLGSGVKITGVAFYVVRSGVSTGSVAAMFGRTGETLQPFTLAFGAITVGPLLAALATPQSLTLTVPAGSLDSTTTEDVLLVVSYSIT